jgi:hypothetical protein
MTIIDYSYRFQDGPPRRRQVHRNLHWDIETSEGQWPVPFAIQGIVYLEATETHGVLGVCLGRKWCYLNGDVKCLGFPR